MRVKSSFAKRSASFYAKRWEWRRSAEAETRIINTMREVVFVDLGMDAEGATA